MNPAIFSRLSRLYDELDAELLRRGATCAGCGVCCHFEAVEHIVYASETERSYLARTHVPPSDPDAAGRGDLLARGLRCPYQRDGQCLARAGRTLGCRLHFCRAADGAEWDEFREKWHSRLKRLHDELGLEWRYRPLLPL